MIRSVENLHNVYSSQKQNVKARFSIPTSDADGRRRFASSAREKDYRGCTHGPGLPSSAMLQGRQFADPRHYADSHASATEERSQEEGRRGGRCRGITGEQTGELLVLMVLRVAGGRRQVLMVQLMVVGVRSDGSAAKDILDEKRCPACGSSVLAWLSLLLLAGRLHFFSFDTTLRLRVHASSRLHPRPGVLARCQGREITIRGRSSPAATIGDRVPFLAPGARRSEISRIACLQSRRYTARESRGSLSKSSLFFRVFRIGDTLGESATTWPDLALADRMSFVPRVHPPTESWSIVTNRHESCHGSDMNRARRRQSLTVFRRRSGRVSVSAARFRAIQPPRRDHR